MNYLGGYTRGFDTATYGSRYSCPTGTPTAAQCTAALPELHPGLLDRAGYRLLDDTRSAVWTKDGWVEPRPSGGDIEDGYLFVYGDKYSQALAELNQLTGPSPLLDESNFGVWYSDYYPYTTSRLREHALPAFRANASPWIPLGQHRLEGPQPVERLGVEPGPVPGSAGVPDLGQVRRASTSPSTSTPASPTTTRSSPATEALAGGNARRRTASAAPARHGTGARSRRPSPTSPCSSPTSPQGVSVLVAGLVL